MNIIDLMVTIVVVTILVTLVLAVVTYIAYKLRLGREPSDIDSGRDGSRFFVEYQPTDTPSTSSSTAAEHGPEA